MTSAGGLEGHSICFHQTSNDLDNWGLLHVDKVAKSGCW